MSWPDAINSEGLSRTHRLVSDTIFRAELFINVNICRLQGKIIMSLTYGYDLKENDDILVPVRKTGEFMIQVVLPGAALVNHLPFCTE